eukprot:jgi/Bigna1/37883/e_gw1.22.54.1
MKRVRGGFNLSRKISFQSRVWQCQREILGRRISFFARQWPGSVTATCRRSLFIQTAPTPNPKSKKLIPGRPVMEEGTLDFQTREEAKISPLARSVFRLRGVEGVFLGQDFLSVTLSDENLWPEIQAEVFSSISEFYDEGKPVIEDMSATRPNDAGTAILDTDDSTVILIKDLLESRIRPTVQEDGGDIAYRGFDNGIVKVELQGSCVGCPSSSVTLKNGVQNMLMHYVPEVMGVEEVSKGQGGDNNSPEGSDEEGNGGAERGQAEDFAVDKNQVERLKDLGF